GKKIATENLPPNNLVFLIDVSGSMNSPEKLPLIKSAFHLLVEQLRPQDKVSIVVYAGNAGVVLEPTSGREKETILAAIDRLQAGGSTAGGEGINLAYKMAKDNLLKDGNNRVILATDGDFNVGVSNDGDLVRRIEEKRDEGIYLTTLGVGSDNFKDSKMQKLADHGNGNYFYLDTIDEARKVFVQQMGGTLLTIAKDVKIQVEFNPAQVKAYRLVGYEKRNLAKEDFNNDKKDAGELGSGHTVTALYEVVPAASAESFNGVDALKYQTTTTTAPNVSDEMMTVKLRYKDPQVKDAKSKLLQQSVKSSQLFAPGTDNLRFAAAVAEFGMLLRNSEFKGIASYLSTLSEAKLATGKDEDGQHAEFFQLIEKAGLLDHTVTVKDNTH
ncbi:MAG: YfbK domain-containing protein, partial [Candidatus Omnitrophota bacterium]